jgi:transcriptional regulator with XRE-family HTH domain
MSSLAERVTEAIRESGVDVAKVAQVCGISVQAVYKWMNGASKTIAGEPLVELARLTNYEARWIVSGKGEKRKDPKATAVYQAMQTMPEYKKDMLVQASTSLAEQPKSNHNGTQ